jgi:hypothetical protein
VDSLTAFGLFAVTAMLVCYVLEDRSPRFILGFADACAMGSAYGFLQGAWPFGLVEAIWAGRRAAAMDAAAEDAARLMSIKAIAASREEYSDASYRKRNRDRLRAIHRRASTGNAAHDDDAGRQGGAEY